MKAKQLFRFSMVALCAILMTGLTACGNKNNGNDPEVPDTKPAGAKMSFVVNFSAASLEIFDVTMEYIDANGEKKSELVKDTKLDKQIYSKTLPAKFGFIMHIAEKEGLDRSKYEYMEMTYDFDFRSCVTNAAGEQITSAHPFTAGNSTKLAIGKIDTYLASYKKNGEVNTLHMYDANGNFSESKWE